jgi:CheY-like chemotaxis protein
MTNSSTEAVDGEGVYIRWKEIGGPAVVAPTRRGFGSVILERTIPFDLQGTAKLRFLIEGLQAEFFIPHHHVSVAPEAMKATVLDGQREPLIVPEAARQPLSGLTVLLVEDNMLIALEAEDMLRLLGAAQVELAPTLPEADRLLKQQIFQFAMLDINVGQATSFDLATKLKSSGIPFLFASGYGDELALNRRNGDGIVIQKPYEIDHLSQAIEQAFSRISLLN